MIRVYLARELEGLRMTRRGRAVLVAVAVPVAVWLAPHVERRDGAVLLAIIAAAVFVGARREK